MGERKTQIKLYDECPAFGQLNCFALYDEAGKLVKVVNCGVAEFLKGSYTEQQEARRLLPKCPLGGVLREV